MILGYHGSAVMWPTLVRAELARLWTANLPRPLECQGDGQMGFILNSSLWAHMILLAQQEGAPPSGGLFSPLRIFTLWMPMGLLFYFLLIRPQGREKANRQNLLESLKKNDRVVTIGGIYGVVINVQRDSDEVTIKVDEATNTKLRVTRGSIARVLADQASNQSSSSK